MSESSSNGTREPFEYRAQSTITCSIVTLIRRSRSTDAFEAALRLARMATVLLVRHGRSSANSGGILAGRTPGVLLDDVGKEQAQATGTRIAALPLRAVVTSPLERCTLTGEAI